MNCLAREVEKENKQHSINRYDLRVWLGKLAGWDVIDRRGYEYYYLNIMMFLDRMTWENCVWADCLWFKPHYTEENNLYAMDGEREAYTPYKEEGKVWGKMWVWDMRK